MFQIAVIIWLHGAVYATYPLEKKTYSINENCWVHAQQYAHAWRGQKGATIGFACVRMPLVVS